jgi:hypothetical protein
MTPTKTTSRSGLPPAMGNRSSGSPFTTQRSALGAQLLRNGKAVPVPDKEGPLKLSRPLPNGFVGVDPLHSNRFAWTDGTPFTPIGFDLGWQDGSLPKIPDQIAKMGKAGVNWTRIWACSWDGKNPWWPDDKTKLAPRELWPSALNQWDQIVQACEAAKVGMQFTLFHHGEFSSQVDPNWPDNPWNAKNGGFLQKPGDFFSDPEAKKRAKVWLRYAVARFGASPSIFGWELFNEVQWADPIHIDHRWDDVEAWHKEMADYVRSLDPYHHPVTSSSELRPNFDSSFDYLQPHTYPNNVVAAVMSTEMPNGKPGFYGEFGLGDMGRADTHQVLKDGLYSGLLANHAGSAMFWYWDRVEHDNLYPIFETARNVANLADWARHPDAKVANVRVATPKKGTFIFQPGLGWGPTTQTDFELPDGATPASVGRLSSYFQGQSHRDMMPKPLQLKFHVDMPSTLQVSIGQISDGGGDLDIKVDGAQAFHASYKKGGQSKAVELTIPAGSHTVELTNGGPDWITLKQISVENLAPQATAEALGEYHWMMVRVTRTDKGSAPLQVSLSSIPLTDGTYHVTEINVDTGQTRKYETTVKEFSTTLNLPNPDQILIFEK